MVGPMLMGSADFATKVVASTSDVANLPDDCLTHMPTLTLTQVKIVHYCLTHLPTLTHTQVKIVHYTCGPKAWQYPRAQLTRCSANHSSDSAACRGGVTPCLSEWTLRWHVARDEVCSAWESTVKLPPPNGCPGHIDDHPATRGRG